MAIIMALALGACAAEVGPVAVEGRVTIVCPGTGAIPALAAPRLHGRATTALAEDGGVPGLAVTTPASDGAAIGRRLDTPLPAMPYLSWGWLWHPGDGGAETAPLRIRVGFTGDGPRERMAHAAPWLASLARDLPGADRYVDLVWRSGDAAIGSWVTVAGVPGLVMRNGGSGAGVWRLESVDLGAIHARLWPRSPLGSAFVHSIFLIVAPSTRGAIAELTLSR